MTLANWVDQRHEAVVRVSKARKLLLVGEPGCGSFFMVKAIALDLGLVHYQCSLAPDGVPLISAFLDNIEAYMETHRTAGNTAILSQIRKFQMNNSSINMNVGGPGVSFRQRATSLSRQEAGADPALFEFAGLERLVDDSEKRAFAALVDVVSDLSGVAVGTFEGDRSKTSRAYAAMPVVYLPPIDAAAIQTCLSGVQLPRGMTAESIVADWRVRFPNQPVPGAAIQAYIEQLEIMAAEEESLQSE